MGVRKRERAKKLKENKKKIAFAKLNNCPSSPRKMRLVADMIRGQQVSRALDILKFSNKEPSKKLEKLLMSAINNWQSKNGGKDSDDNKKVDVSSLFVQEIRVDGGTFLKRLQTAPQGRAHRIRKRSNHVTLVVEKRNKDNN